MPDPRRLAARPGVTFWIVLASGAICGAAVAATPGGGIEPVPQVAAPEAAQVPTPEAPTADLEEIPAIPDVPEPAAAPTGTVRTERAARREDTRVAPAAPAPREAAGSPAREAAPEPLILRDGRADTVAPRQETGTQEGFGNLIALVALLVAAGAIFIHLRSRKDGAASDGRERMEVLSSIRLAGKWPVSLVRVPGRVLVVGATDKGVTLLAELDPDGRAPQDDDLQDEVDEDVPFFDLASRLDAEDDEPLTYRRTRRAGPATRAYAERPVARAATRPATRDRSQAQEEQKDEAFLDHLLDRLADAKPAVIRQAAPEDERDALRQRVKTLRRGPTRL